MQQTTIKHTGTSGSVRIVFTNAPATLLRPGEELVIWVTDDGQLHSPVGTRRDITLN